MALTRNSKKIRHNLARGAGMRIHGQFGQLFLPQTRHPFLRKPAHNSWGKAATKSWAKPATDSC